MDLGAPPTAGRQRTNTKKCRTDRDVMDTNNSSIVSKRSVEKFYRPDDVGYHRCFVNKFKRRSPLINRGYWLRMKAVESTVARLLSKSTAKKRLVINLGCGQYVVVPISA